MADKNIDYVMAGLRDAHAMEIGTVGNLKRLIERTEDDPELKAGLRSIAPFRDGSAARS